MARLAKSLDVLRSQINVKYPSRSKLSDGWIGDAAHQATGSDHNPNAADVVNALDITHDPAKGPDTWKLAELLRINRDPRIKYVISNGRIFSSVVEPWQWRPYTGPNKHAHHVHVSVLTASADEPQPWKIDFPINSSAVTPRPPEVKPAGITADMRRRMGRAIIDFEARRVNGKLAIYHLPANDGGGTYEVAGINDRYHPAQAAKLKALIEAGKYEEAEASVADYLIAYTNVAAGWTPYAGVEFYLRDSVFNRGPTGAARILQRAVVVPDDGQIGPTTRAAMSVLSAEILLINLRAAREEYEREVVGYRANFWKGLVNRWDKALVAARSFQKEQGALPPVVTNTVKVTVPSGIVAYTLWDTIAAYPFLAAIIAAGIVAGGLYGWRAFKAWRDKPPAAPTAPSPAIIKDI